MTPLLLVAGSVFVLSSLALHLLHRRIAREFPGRAVPAGRVLLEVAPSTKLARDLTRGKVRHPLAGAYRALWYVHLASGLVFALALIAGVFVR